MTKLGTIGSRWNVPLFEICKPTLIHSRKTESKQLSGNKTVAGLKDKLFALKALPGMGGTPAYAGAYLS